MKSKKLLAVIGIVIPFLIVACTACPIYYKDGGTVEYNYIVLKVIKWHTLEGKNYTEAYVFPMSLLPIDLLPEREEEDFKRLVSSALPDVLYEPYGFKPLLDAEFESRSDKLYKKILSRGKRNNYFLVEKMLSDEPTAFCLPNVVSPMTEGDIAFCLLCDINNADDKVLFADISQRADFSASMMFEYLHESEMNRVKVARAMLDNYIDSKEDLKYYFYHLEQEAQERAGLLQ